MSGNPPTVDLIGTSMSSLVHAITATRELTGQEVIVIGGLAVICRLTAAHRATTDLNTVDRHHDVQEPQLQLLLRHTHRPSGPSGTEAGAIAFDPAADGPGAQRCCDR